MTEEAPTDAQPEIVEAAPVEPEPPVEAATPEPTEAPLTPEPVPVTEAPTPEPLAPEPVPTQAAAPTEAAPAGTDSAAPAETARPTPTPAPTRAPYIEVFAAIDGLDQVLTPGEAVSLRFSASYLEDGKRLCVSDEKGRGTDYSQALAQKWLSACWLTFDDSFARVFTTTDGKLPRAELIVPVRAKNCERLGLVPGEDADGEPCFQDRRGDVYYAGTPFNLGRCILDGLSVRADAAPGEHAIRAVLHWIPISTGRETSVDCTFKAVIAAPAATPAPPMLEQSAEVEPEAQAAVAETAAPAETPAPTEPATEAPTLSPTETPAEAPTETATEAPASSETPTAQPTETPTAEPTEVPTVQPTETPAPVLTPEPEPTETPAPTPTAEATAQPTPESSTEVAMRPERIYTTQGRVLPGSSYNVQFGIELLRDGSVRHRTNANGRPDAKYSQAITKEVKALWVELDEESFWRIFSAESAEAPRADVIVTLDPTTAAASGLRQDRRDGNLFRDSYDNVYHTGDAYNNGFASFYGLTLRDDLEAGEYAQTGRIRYVLAEDDEVRENDFAFTVTVAAEEKPSGNGGGGGYYGGGGGGGDYGGGGGEAVATPAPAAKLIIERMETQPLRPRPGDEFAIVLTLRNTSAAQRIQNIDLTYTTENNVIRPLSGLNRVHIDALDPGKTLDVKLDVFAGPEIASDLVHMEVAFDYEEKDAAAKQATQEVFLRLERVQRMELDEPVLPNDAPMAQESFTVKLKVMNKGRNTLDNVTARVVSDNPDLMTGGSWYGGNLESGDQKTAELTLIPAVGGDFTATVEVSYEDAITGKSVAETRELSFYAQEAESYEDYYYDEPYPEDGGEMEDGEDADAPLTLKERLSALPAWVAAALGGGAMLAFCLLIALVRRIRRKAMEDDALD